MDTNALLASKIDNVERKNDENTIIPYIVIIPVIISTTICSTYLVLMYYDVHSMISDLNDMKWVIMNMDSSKINNIIQEFSSLENCVVSKLCRRT